MSKGVMSRAYLNNLLKLTLNKIKLQQLKKYQVFIDLLIATGADISVLSSPEKMMLNVIYSQS